MSTRDSSGNTTEWWTTLGGDTAYRTAEALAGLLAELARAVSETADRQDSKREYSSFGLSLLNGDVTKDLLNYVAAPVHDIAQTLQQLTHARQQDVLQRVSQVLRSVMGTDSVDRLRMVFFNAPVAIAVSTGEPESKIIDANPAFAALFGKTRPVLDGAPLAEFTKNADEQYEWLKVVAAGSGTTRFEAPYERTDGRMGWVMFAITYIAETSDRKPHLLAVADDVTEQRERHHELYWQARQDPLTGLPNRRYLAEALRSAVAIAGPEDKIGLCFLDLDNFKIVNDRLGHVIGDQVLTLVANRLSDAARVIGREVIRLGGDEFVSVIQPPSTADEAFAVAKHLSEAMTAPFEVDGVELRIGASIGVNVVNASDTHSLNSLMDGADSALYESKARGGGGALLAPDED